MYEELPEAVRDNRLETIFTKRYEVIHLIDDPDAPPSAPPRREQWKSEKKPVGRGGQGQVYIQRCISGPSADAQRAVKMIPHQEGGGRRRYIRELTAVTRFSHARYSKHFVKSLGWYETKDTLCITMEYLPHGDLQQYLKDDQSMPEEDSRHIIRQVLQGLAIMHREGFTHGDIKPKNILIKQPATDEGPHTWWIKLADFGISKRVKEASHATTFMGTDEYMAPELLQKLPGDKFSADLWAVGSMTFRMLTAEPAFPSPWAVFKYLDDPDGSFPVHNFEKHGAGSNCEAFIRLLMKPKHEERPSSAEALDHAWVRISEPTSQDPLPESGEDSSGGASSSGEDNSSTTEIGLTTRMSTMSEIALPIRKQESFDNLYQSVPSGTVSFSRLPADEVNFLVDTEPTLRFFYKMPFKRFKQILTSMYSKDVSFLTSTMKHLGVKDTMRRLIKVSLYQQVIYCDDSTSMRRHGRWDAQKKLAEKITDLTTLVMPDDTGVALRFINADVDTSLNLSSEHVREVIDPMPARPVGDTEIATNLKSKILQPLVYNKIKSKKLERPLLVTIMTDGMPEPENKSLLRETILECGRQLKDAGYPAESVRFVIGQLGPAKSATRFLDTLREDQDLAPEVIFISSARLDLKVQELENNEPEFDRWVINTLAGPMTKFATESF